MSATKNKHGLSRDVPDPIRRVIRQRCGFGCIVCGCAIVQYHHFDPPFADATSHEATGITLACGKDHTKAENGLIDPAEIKRLDSDPICKRAGFTGDFLFLSRGEPQFRIGSATFRREIVMTYDGSPIIWFDPPECSGGPLRLSAELSDGENAHLLSISENDWRAGVEHFDIETFKNELVIRSRKGQITLRMVREPGGHIALERLQMAYRGFRVSVEKRGTFTVQKEGGARLQLHCPNIYATLTLHSNGAASFGPLGKIIVGEKPSAP